MGLDPSDWSEDVTLCAADAVLRVPCLDVQVRGGVSVMGARPATVLGGGPSLLPESSPSQGPALSRCGC